MNTDFEATNLLLFQIKTNVKEQFLEPALIKIVGKSDDAVIF